jgi:hypothetical protein
MAMYLPVFANPIAAITVDYQTPRPNLFVFDARAYWEYLGIPPHHPKWNEFELKLSLSNQVYNNGAIKIYSS